MRIMTVAFGTALVLGNLGSLVPQRMRRPKSFVNHGRGLSSGCP